jgi:phage tail tape-measure protein
VAGLLKNNFQIPEKRGVFNYDAALDEQIDYQKQLGQAASYANVASAGAKQGSFTTGILGGAATGASMGSIFPGIGTAAGALAGGVLGGIATAVGKKKEPEVTKAQKTFNENLQLQNEALKQKYDENQNRIEWYTQLRNAFKYR